MLSSVKSAAVLIGFECTVLYGGNHGVVGAASNEMNVRFCEVLTCPKTSRNLAVIPMLVLVKKLPFE